MEIFTYESHSVLKISCMSPVFPYSKNRIIILNILIRAASVISLSHNFRFSHNQRFLVYIVTCNLKALKYFP